MTADRATVSDMETKGTYRQELDAWHRATDPVTQPRAVYRCPWDRCCHHYHRRDDLHRHLDIRHGGNAPHA